MKAYYIIDEATGNRWARNKWATPNSLPDLYKNQNNAYWQIAINGKVFWMCKRNPALRPVIRMVTLTF